MRNRQFHEWSEAAQPDGFPDVIVEKFGYTDEGALRAVERGAADLTGVGGELHPTHLLQTGYARQLHVTPNLVTRWFSLNTRLPPFDDVRVRRAVNYAVDRNRLVALDVGELSHPTCEVLPPNLPGYRRYCPYTIRPSADGKYTGPYFAEARKLVAASGTKGQAVTVWAWKTDLGARYLVSVLRRLGYKAHLKGVKDLATLFAEIGDSRRKIQATSNGWGADYPATSNFFSPLFTCASFKPGTTGNNNVPEFCNRQIDAEIARAQALQTSDPQQAAHLWSKIDRDIVDQAPVVATFNPQLVDLVSRRVSNYRYSPAVLGADLDQLWVR